MYFEQFNLRWQGFPDGSHHLITNICNRVAVSKQAKNFQSVLYDHLIDVGDSPDVLSYKIYGTPDYWWVICLVNDIHDIQDDWPLTDQELTDYTTKKYPLNTKYDIHHYEYPSGKWTTPESAMMIHGLSSTESAIATFSIRSINIGDYEGDINDNKRTIKLIRSEYIEQFRDELETLFAD
ncbi:MAG: baseplate wedge protein 53 [Candidatus Peribacteraceae bacterium]|nr:baseplate wedge protein 53 [Candidatus Peribacteraceae bacterium]